MTLIIRIGRRVPKSLKSRIVNTVKGLIGFQENIWLMIKMSLDMSRRQYVSGVKKAEGRMDTFNITRELESEDTFWKLEWCIVTIQGDEKCETAEYNEAINMYKDLKHVLKKMPKDGNDDKLKQVFKSKLIPQEKLTEAYTKGYGSSQDKNISNILLEMGIITHIERIEDYDTRSPTPDF